MRKTIKLVLLFLPFIAISQQILPEVERAMVVDEILEERFNVLLPQLMDDAELDMWVLISREYNEDPVLRTMLPAKWLNARRRTILLFYRNKDKNTIEKLRNEILIKSASIFLKIIILPMVWIKLILTSSWPIFPKNIIPKWCLQNN